MSTLHTVSSVELLIAEDDATLRELFGRGLERVPEIAGTIVEDSESAVKAIEHGNFGIVISDGLNGGWYRVLSSATESKARPVLYSARDVFLAEAADSGILAFNKSRPFTQVLPEIIRSVYPELNLSF